MKRNNLEKVEDIATASEVASSGATKFEENEPEYGERNSFDEEHDDRRIFGSKRLASFVGAVVPLLTIHKGTQKMSHKKSYLVVILFYISHSLSAWGDRMWAFAVSLLLVLLYPGSLLLPGIHGFMVQLTVAVLGTVVGDYVDFNPRLKVAVFSLVLQNGLLSLCSIVIAIMFFYNLNVCLHPMLFILLVVVVILLASGANLASVMNTISIEKDWIVVLADGNTDTLTVLNANMRRIDLCCKLLAPVLTGVFMQQSDSFITTIIIAVWNVLSFFIEAGLLWLVYTLVPTLAVKKLRASQMPTSSPKSTSEDVNMEGACDDKAPFISDKVDEKMVGETRAIADQLKPTGLKKKACLPRVLFTFIDGWKIFIRQEVAIVGFSLAVIYLTVLGFSGVTSSYLLTQGLRKDFIGLFQGLGAIFGVTGTVLYPFLRKRFGTIRTGLFGFSTQVFFLLFCVVAVIIPSKTVSSGSLRYYSPNCQEYFNSTTIQIISSSATLPSSTLLIQPTPTFSPAPTHTVDEYAAPISTPDMPEDSNEPTSLPILDSSMGVNISLYLLLTGIVACRIGLWIFDLAVQQLVQEKVIEEERGVVSGVMNAMNSVMDMMHYVLVIIAPHPENFNILTLISFSMVVLGWLLYCIYVRKARGHFFHFHDFARRLKMLFSIPLSKVGTSGGT